MSTWDGVERRDLSQSQVELERKISQLVEKVHELDKSINSIIGLHAESLKSLMSLHAAMQTMLNEHNLMLLGNHNSKGITTRLELLEGLEESRRWTFRLMWATIVSFFAKLFYDIVRKG